MQYQNIASFFISGNNLKIAFKVLCINFCTLKSTKSVSFAFETFIVFVDVGEIFA